MATELSQKRPRHGLVRIHPEFLKRGREFDGLFRMRFRSLSILDFIRGNFTNSV